MSNVAEIPLKKRRMNQFEKKILMAGAIKALDYIQAIELRDVAPSAQAIKNLDVFDEELTDQGVDALETIEFLDENGSPGTVASNGSRYYGFVIGGSHPAALAANWLASAWDQMLAFLPPARSTQKLKQLLKNGLRKYCRWPRAHRSDLLQA